MPSSQGCLLRGTCACAARQHMPGQRCVPAALQTSSHPISCGIQTEDTCTRSVDRAHCKLRSLQTFAVMQIQKFILRKVHSMPGSHLLSCVVPQNCDTRATLCGFGSSDAAARLPVTPRVAVAACEGTEACDRTPQLAMMTS